MRSFFRLLMMSLVLVTVGVMSALTAMRVAIHGRETTVPSFVKLTVADAERLAINQGLAVTMDGQFYSPDVPEGRIVSQQPPSGTRVRRGWRVRLAQSLGVQRVTVPDLQGQSPRAAELNVRQRGLEVDTIAEAHVPDALPDQVIAQSPPPNAAGVQSPKVSLLVASAADPQAYVMPNFVGRPLADAGASIEQAGFKLATVQNAPPAVANGTAAPAPASITAPTVVVRQEPAAGQKISAGATITLVVGH
jgi:beta-lactam-binding protein with PASTA domain